jgi:hypothetical protein
MDGTLLGQKHQTFGDLIASIELMSKGIKRLKTGGGREWMFSTSCTLGWIERDSHLLVIQRGIGAFAAQ